MAHLNGGTTGGKNGSVLLNGSTVHSHDSGDRLIGGTGHDRFFANLAGKKDKSMAWNQGELVTEI